MFRQSTIRDNIGILRNVWVDLPLDTPLITKPNIQKNIDQRCWTEPLRLGVASYSGMLFTPNTKYKISSNTLWDFELISYVVGSDGCSYFCEVEIFDIDIASIRDNKLDILLR